MKKTPTMTTDEMTDQIAEMIAERVWDMARDLVDQNYGKLNDLNNCDDGYESFLSAENDVLRKVTQILNKEIK